MQLYETLLKPHFSSKFAAFLQNTFSEEHLWKAASGHLHYNKKHTFSCFLSLSIVIIHQFHSYTKILTLIPVIPTPVPRIPTLIPSISRAPILFPIIPTLIPLIPTLIPRIPISPFIPFPDYPFRLLQIA